MTRRRMLSEMDAEEMLEWETVYTMIEPLPEDRADLRMGITVANLLTPHAKKGASIRPSEFIPDFSGEQAKEKRVPKPQQTREQMEAVIKRINAVW